MSTINKVLIISCYILALSLQNVYSQREIDSSGLRIQEQVNCLGTTNLKSADLNWKITLINKPILHKTIDKDQDIIDSIKIIKLKQKLSSILSDTNSYEPTELLLNPIKGTNFQGNPNNGWTPLDNSIAISNSGYIVSVANSSIQIFNSGGTSLYYNSIANFINNSQIQSAFDPHVLYDRQSNRFIFVALSGTVSSSSRLIVCFSKTSNPATGGWWRYIISGNPLNNQCWSDYPKIAVTNEELIVTSNLFTNNGNFNQAIIRQFDKSDGYNGTTMNGLIWYNVSGNPASILPVGHGHGGSYGPICYLVCTSPSGGNWIRLYKITGYIQSNPNLIVKTISSAYYSPAGDATQKGTSNLLDVGDCRALNGFYLNGKIHFVLNNDKGNGWCGIRYNRLDVVNESNQALQWFGSANNDYAYGTVVSFATSSTDKSVMIGMARTSTTVYPEMRVVNVDNSGSFSSSITIKAGVSYINATNSSIERWGDYSGSSRKHNNSTPSIWLSGAYATSVHTWSTWISEVHENSGSYKNSEEIPLLSDSNLLPRKSKLYPQPASESFSIEFNLIKDSRLLITLYNEDGKVIKELFKGQAFSGDNILSFNQANLANGVYLLIGQDLDNGALLLKEKVIILN
jgi:hypothetical protein